MQNHVENANSHAPANRCSFIRQTGDRCGSPSLRGTAFCYHHDQTRSRVANPQERNRRLNTFELSAPGNRTAIQDALGVIFLRIADNEIDLRRAGLLLYCLQIATANLSAAEKEHSSAAATLSDRSATQEALGKIFDRIDNRELEPRQAGLLLYCLQIASANLKARHTSQSVAVANAAPGKLTAQASASKQEKTNLQRSDSKEAPEKVLLNPESPATCPTHPRSGAPEPSTKGSRISRGVFGALLESLARRQGIDIEKVHEANEATILLRLNAAAEPDAAQDRFPFPPNPLFHQEGLVFSESGPAPVSISYRHGAANSLTRSLADPPAHKTRSACGCKTHTQPAQRQAT